MKLNLYSVGKLGADGNVLDLGFPFGASCLEEARFLVQRSLKDVKSTVDFKEFKVYLVGSFDPACVDQPLDPALPFITVAINDLEDLLRDDTVEETWKKIFDEQKARLFVDVVMKGGKVDERK